MLETVAGYKLRCEHGPLDARETTSDLPAGKVEKLRWFIDAEVNSRWYCRYVANVFGGTQWELFDGSLERYGSNLFPQGFGDLTCFHNRHPEYKDYGSILAENGMHLDVDQIKAHDVRGASPECIVAMVLAMLCADHFDGWSDVFGTCAKDGTFGRWLARLGGARIINSAQSH